MMCNTQVSQPSQHQESKCFYWSQPPSTGLCPVDHLPIRAWYSSFTVINDFSFLWILMDQSTALAELWPTLHSPSCILRSAVHAITELSPIYFTEHFHIEAREHFDLKTNPHLIGWALLTRQSANTITLEG